MNRFSSLLGLFWFLATAFLGMTAALLVIGAGRLVPNSEMRLAIVVALVLFAIHSANQFRHRHDPITDPRVLRAKERRGF